MDRRRDVDRGSVTVAGFGAVLLAAATIHHLRESSSVGELAGPLSALALDGVPALALVYAGYWLWNADLGPDHTAQIARWCLGGAALFAGTFAVSVVIRAVEGRAVTEPQFTLLLAAGVGGLAGCAAAYYRVRAEITASRAERTAKALVFVNGVIRHDLRNDLQVVLGNAQRIEAGAEAPAVADSATAIRETVTKSVDRIETAQGLVDALTGAADPEPVDLSAVVAEVAARVRETTDATVETDLPESATVVADVGLRSVVDNLVENAVEHNDADRPAIAVTVETEDDTVRLVVRDNGPGIPPSEREALFENPEEATPGGLQIVQTLVDSYGGTVRIFDASPRGAKFVVALPAAERAQQTRGESQRADGDTETADDGDEKGAAGTWSS
ncbi:ATP-binding protein [Halosimplex sp. J119]